MMEKNKMAIIGLIIVIVALLAGCAVMMQTPQKEATKLKITSNKTINEGDNLKVRLTTLNGSAISNETINISLTDSDGVTEYFSAVTNDKGIAKLKLKDAGNYTVNCTYGGNENYTGNGTVQKLEIKEEVVVEEPTYTQSSSSKSNLDGYRYSEDAGGYIKEYTDSKGVDHVDYSDGRKMSYDHKTNKMTYDDGKGNVVVSDDW